MTTYALAFHATYRCGRSGACCTSGWPIPVEAGVEARLRRALAARSLRVTAQGECFEGAGAHVRLGLDPSGRCRFYEPSGLCAIHSDLGHDALPIACRIFPRVCLSTPRGVSVTLSHYCPTAARLLFGDGAVAIVADPPAFPRDAFYEGLDASKALPPLLRPGVWMGWEEYFEWEAHAVAVVAEGTTTAIGRLASEAEALRRWTPVDGAFDAFLRRTLDRGHAPRPLPDATQLFEDVRASIPPQHEPGPPPAMDAAELPGQWAAVVGRYLAARAFGSWIAIQGDGVRTFVHALAAAHAVLKLETARAAGAERRSLDADLLLQAIRRSDLLLTHLASPEALARRLSAAERG